MSSLYELNTAYRSLMERLYDEELPEEAIIDTLDSLEGAIEDKADGYAMIMRELEADADKLKAEEKRLESRRMALENKAKRLKANLYESMKAVGKPKFKTTLFSFGIQKNGGSLPVILTPGCDVPPEWLKPGDPDTTGIRKHLEAGHELGFATLGERGEHLRIR